MRIFWIYFNLSVRIFTLNNFLPIYSNYYSEYKLRLFFTRQILTKNTEIILCRKCYERLMILLSNLAPIFLVLVFLIDRISQTLILRYAPLVTSYYIKNIIIESWLFSVVNICFMIKHFFFWPIDQSVILNFLSVLVK